MRNDMLYELDDYPVVRGAEWENWKKVSVGL